MNSTAAKINQKIIRDERRGNLKVIDKNPPEQKLTGYKKLYKTDVTLIASAKAGVSSHAVTDIITISEKTFEEISSLLYVTPRTIKNYQNDNKNLPVLQSEQLLKLYALYDKGIEVFGSADSFNRWLYKPAFGLSSEIPNNLLITSTGIRLIMDELSRIQYGDFS